MAERALQRLEDQLNCSVCLDTYTSPKLLLCLHVFCQNCLKKLVVKGQQGQLSVTCPTCRHVTPLPPSGVAGLQAAFQVNQLLEIVEEAKGMAERAPPVLTSSSVEEKEACPAPQKPSCPDHEGVQRELYCETCEELVCWKCIIKGGKHFGHDCEEICSAYNKYKAEIMLSLAPMEKQLQGLDQAVGEFGTSSTEVSDQQQAIVGEIHAAMSQLHEALDRRETELYTQLNSITQTKLKVLAAQKDQVESSRAQLGSCLAFMKENVETGDQGEVLLKKSCLARKVTELTASVQLDKMKPSSQPRIVFSAAEELVKDCERHGQVSVECYATGRGLQEAQVGEKTEVVLFCLGQAIVCELVSEITGNIVKGSVDSTGHNQYLLTYQPAVKGRHQLHIKVDGNHMKGSPFFVVARSPVDELNAPVRTIIEVKGPEGVVMSEKGEMVVTDWSEHCVSVFSASGKKLLSFGSHGSTEGQFRHPCGVAIDADANILVADSGNHRIQKFTAEGEFITAIGTEGCRPLKFGRPTGITYNRNNSKIYVSDRANHQVQILYSDLSHCRTFGRCGSGEGEFSYPKHLACDSMGNVYVADRGNHRIQVFTPEGEFLRVIGGCNGTSAGSSSGSSDNSAPATSHCDGALANNGSSSSDTPNSPSSHKQKTASEESPNSTSPVSVATGKESGSPLSPHSQTAVAESSSSGSKARPGSEACGKEAGVSSPVHGEGAGCLDSPYAIAVDAQDMLYVSEWGAHRVSVFTQEGQLVTSFGKWGREVSWKEYMTSFGRKTGEAGELKEPCGLAVDSTTGVLFVCDYGNNCVHMF